MLEKSCLDVPRIDGGSLTERLSQKPIYMGQVWIERGREFEIGGQNLLFATREKTSKMAKTTPKIHKIHQI